MKLEELVPEAGDLSNFIEQFEVFASVPGGVEKIRSLIYQLAVSGRLVAHSSEETASDYLNFLNSERADLVTKKKSKKSILNTINIVHPFSLPQSWEWTYLDLISQDIHYGYTASANQNLNDVRLLRITDIQDNKVNWDSVPGCVIDDKKYESNSLESGDLLIARTGGTVGKSYLVENICVKAVFASYLIRVKPLKSAWRKYLKLFTLTPLYWEQLIDKTSGSAQPNVNATSLKTMLVPIPSLEEQKRIVAKVDELKALCDKLEAQQQQQANNVLRANTAAINALLNPSSQETNFEQNWQRTAQHFNTLYGCTLPMPKGEGRKKKYLVGLENVKALRQAILKLSVKGKLTQTQPQDGSAEELLEIINAGIDTKKLKKLMRLPSPEELFGLPSKWVWSSFWRVADIQSNLVKPELYSDMPHIAPNHIEKDNGILSEYSTVLDDGVKSNKHYFYAGQILYSKIRPNLNKLTIVDFEGLCSADMYPIRAKIDTNYLCLYMLSSYFVDQTVAGDNRVAMPKVNQERLNSISVPVPPLEEQKRIVAKVDQLMTLCDQLEQQLTQSYSDAEKLMQTTVKALAA